MTADLVLVLKLSIVAMIFAVGLGSTPGDLLYLWRRPAELARSLLAMYVAVPLAALLMVKTLPLGIPVKTAILVLAISAGAPLLPKKLMKIGREGYVFSLVVIASLLAVVVVPAWLADPRPRLRTRIVRGASRRRPRHRQGLPAPSCRGHAPRGGLSRKWPSACPSGSWASRALSFR